MEFKIYTLYIIHKIETKFNAGEDITADVKTLLSYRKADGGWGHLRRASTNFHTAYAVRVLNTIKYSDRKIIDATLNYLKSRQNTVGGWGFKQGDDSSILMTSTVIITFSLFKETYSLQTSINKGVDYLLSMQNPDGSFSTKRRQ
jgi:prenyltransferase beta subunit